MGATKKKWEAVKDESRIVKFKAIYKDWIIPVALLSACEICIFAANKENSKRIATAVAAYELTNKKFNDYKDAAVETVGKKKADKIREKANEKRVAENPPIEGINIIDTGTGDLIFHERDITGLYFKASRDYIERVLLEINQDLLNTNLTYSITVAEIIEKLSGFKEGSKALSHLRKMLPLASEHFGFSVESTGSITYEINPVVYSTDPNDPDGANVIFEIELDNWTYYYDDYEHSKHYGAGYNYV